MSRYHRRMLPWLRVLIGASLALLAGFALYHLITDRRVDVTNVSAGEVVAADIQAARQAAIAESSQLEFLIKNGASASDLCFEMRRVADLWARAQNESLYRQWRDAEQQQCKVAGVDGR